MVKIGATYSVADLEQYQEITQSDEKIDRLFIIGYDDTGNIEVKHFYEGEETRVKPWNEEALDELCEKKVLVEQE